MWDTAKPHSRFMLVRTISPLLSRDFSVHGLNFSNSELEGGSSCALSVTVTQLCMIYKLQRIVTFSAFFYICAFVFVILLCNVIVITYMWFLCEFGHFNGDFGYFSCRA